MYTRGIVRMYCALFNKHILWAIQVPYRTAWNLFTDLVALTNDGEGSDNEEQDTASGVAMDVRNGAESDALIDARTSRMFHSILLRSNFTIVIEFELGICYEFQNQSEVVLKRSRTLKT